MTDDQFDDLHPIEEEKSEDPAKEKQNQLAIRLVLLTVTLIIFVGIMGQSRSGSSYKPSDEVGKLGTVEGSAKLVEIPGKYPANDNFYNYVFVMKYEVSKVHRGKVEAETIYVGHYNPRKERAKVADDTCDNVGGTLKQFQVGDVHRMALDVPIDDHYIGAKSNFYGDRPNPPKIVYWGRWTELER